LFEGIIVLLRAEFEGCIPKCCRLLPAGPLLALSLFVIMPPDVPMAIPAENDGNGIILAPGGGFT
jgi:hypothetical protein